MPPMKCTVATDFYKIPIGTELTLQVVRDIFDPNPYLAYCGAFTTKRGTEVPIEFPVEMIMNDKINFKESV